MPSTSLEERITQHAYAMGFDAIGFCEATLSEDVEKNLRAFIAEKRHGTMRWMEERIEQRSQPKNLWSDVKSVISLGLSYTPGYDPFETLQKPDCGNISVYARNRDYHDVLKGMLKQLAQFIIKHAPDGTQLKVFVDTAPVAERDLAVAAQLGWRGKHGCLVSRTHGSWLFLGEIYTTLSLTPSHPKGGQCGTCTKCLTSCPTDAFLAPMKMDARRCISYLTIEHKGSIPRDLRPKMGNRIYGCDDCVGVCPWNSFAQTAQTMKFHAKEDYISPPLSYLVSFDDAHFRKYFSGSPIKRIGRDRFVRNVLIAIGNSQDKSLIKHATPLLQDPDPDIAETAQWAIDRLSF